MIYDRRSEALIRGVITFLAWAIALILLLGWVLAPFLAGAAHAGACRIYGDGEYTVEACDNGSFETWDRHGRHRQYGDRNGWAA